MIFRLLINKKTCIFRIMHSSAIINLERFFKIYLKEFDSPKILDYGGASVGNQTTALDILNKNYKNFKYVSLDVTTSKNVDIVLKDPYKISEIENESFDIVISTSTFEHIEFFWLAYLQILNILKPKGIFYMNAPSNGNFHRWEKDCWRFYPDSGEALAKWGRYNNFNPVCLESYSSNQILEGGWNDYVSIILKNEKYLKNFNNKIILEYNDFYNGIDNNGKIYNLSSKSEDHKNWGYKLWYKLRKKIDKKKYKINY